MQFDPDMFLTSFSVTLFGELGDKTHLLALLLTLRFKTKLPVILGILVATFLNHYLAAYVATMVASFFETNLMNAVLAIFYFAFAIWILKSNEDDHDSSLPKWLKSWGPFSTTVVMFFLAEMGDKTQIATAALSAQFKNPLMITIATTAAMLVVNGTTVVFGSEILKKISLRWINRISAISFLGLSLHHFFLIAASSLFQ